MSGARESMDRITRSYLEDFRQEQSLGELADEDTFELFANYCVVSDVYGDEFDVNDIHVGGTGDLGIDGIATVVNGHFCGRSRRPRRHQRIHRRHVCVRPGEDREQLPR
jgi:hypothetical protein